MHFFLCASRVKHTGEQWRLRRAYANALTYQKKVWYWNMTITHFRPAHSIVRKRHKTLTGLFSTHNICFASEIRKIIFKMHSYLEACSHQDDCKTRKDSKYYTTKQGPSTEPPKQWENRAPKTMGAQSPPPKTMGGTINTKSKTTEPLP